MSGSKGINPYCIQVPAGTPVETVSFEKEPLVIAIDRSEEAERNCFVRGTWTRAPSLHAVGEGRSVLRFGHRGPAVMRLQRLLNDLHPEYKPLKVDGRFGPETEARLRSFQHEHGIGVDGVVGTETLKALAGVAVRGLMLDERFASLPEELQLSAIHRIEGSTNSEDRLRMVEILRSEDFAALGPDSQERVFRSEDPVAFFEFARALADWTSPIE